MDLSTGNIRILPEHQVGTGAEGGLRGTKMGHGEAPRLGESQMGTIGCTVWEWRRKGRFVFNNNKEDIHYSVFTTKLLVKRQHYYSN